MITPRIVGTTKGLSPLANQNVVTADGAVAIALGSWLESDTAGFKATASAQAAAAYVCTGILLADGITPKMNQYLTTTEADSNAYKLKVVPIGGLIFEMEEDGDGGNITSTAYTGFCDIVVTAPADYSEAEKTADGIAGAHANIKIDSSSFNASSGSGLLCEILGVAGVDQAIVGQGTSPAHSTGTGRIFRVKVIDANATYSQ